MPDNEAGRKPGEKYGTEEYCVAQVRSTLRAHHEFERRLHERIEQLERENTWLRTVLANLTFDIAGRLEDRNAAELERLKDETDADFVPLNRFLSATRNAPPRLLAEAKALETARDALAMEHGGQFFEPECPYCHALAVINAALEGRE